eukprot:676725-Prymnesium_polylepis.1
MGEPSYVQLELDEKEKENLQELQTSVKQAENELRMVSARLQQREIEGARPRAIPRAHHTRPRVRAPCQCVHSGRSPSPLRRRPGKRAELTKIELDTVADDTKAYVQVGKMFLFQPLPEIKAGLAKTVEDAGKECAGLKEKQVHHKEVRRPCAH